MEFNFLQKYLCITLVVNFSDFSLVNPLILKEITNKKNLNTRTLHLKDLEKEQQMKPKASRREVVQIRADINDTETNKKHPQNRSMKSEE